MPTRRSFPCSRGPAVWTRCILTDDGSVRAIKSMKDSNIWINGGYFVLRKDVFRYIKPGEELVYEPFQRMISEERSGRRATTGFWQCMDTFRDKQILDELEASGEAPWCSVEERQPGGASCAMLKLSLPTRRRRILW